MSRKITHSTLTALATVLAIGAVGMPAAARSLVDFSGRAQDSGLSTVTFLSGAFEEAPNAESRPAIEPGVAPDAIAAASGEEDSADESASSCNEYPVAPADFFGEYMNVASELGVSHITYFSAGVSKTKTDARLAVKDLLLPGCTDPTALAQVFYGKGTPDQLRWVVTQVATDDKLETLKSKGMISGDNPQELRQSLVEKTIGLDCNGFPYAWTQRAGIGGFTVNTDPPAYSPPARRRAKLGSVCSGDFVVYTNVRHVAIVDKISGDELTLVESLGEEEDGVSRNTYKIKEDGANAFQIQKGNGTWRDVTVASPK